MALLRGRHRLRLGTPVTASSGQKPNTSDSFAFIRSVTARSLARLIKYKGGVDREALELTHELLGRERVLRMLDLLRKEGFFPPDRDWEYLKGDPCEVAAEDPDSLVALIEQELTFTGYNLMRPLQKLVVGELMAFAGKVYRSGTVLETNLDELTGLFGLTDLERRLVLFILSCRIYEPAYHCMNTALEAGNYPGKDYLAAILECRTWELEEAMEGRLRSTGILEERGSGMNLDIEWDIMRLLLRPNGNTIETAFFRCEDTLEAPPLEAHAIATKTTDLALALLGKPMDEPVHILLYGPPGTGKTSYAKGLVRELGMKMLTVGHGDKISSDRRRAAVTAAFNVAVQSDDLIVLVDDADEILGTRGTWQLFGAKPDRRHVHEILELPRVRAIWTINHAGMLEESVVRRFTLPVEFRSFGVKQRELAWRTVLEHRSAEALIPEEKVFGLARRFQVSPAIVDMAVSRALEAARDGEDLADSVELILDAHETLTGFDSIGRHYPLEEHPVMDGINMGGADPEALMEELKAFDRFARERGRECTVSMSLLFYGPPGTGKSHFARMIGEALDREVLVKHASDILGPFVGMTEHAISAAYREAESRDAVLVFDEADTFLRSRNMAEHSWEGSFTNTFLTCMEHFRGVQIFTTNRLEDLDPAALRRFTHKVEFRYLDAHGKALFFDLFLAPLIPARSLDEGVYEALKAIDMLTPGDFKAVRDRWIFRDRSGLSARELLNSLTEETRTKMLQAGKKPIGFTAANAG